MRGAVLLTIALLTVSGSSINAAIVLTPSYNQLVPYNTVENVTYHCQVDSGEEAIWDILGFQPQTQAQKNRYKTDHGIYIMDNPSQMNESWVTVTRFSSSGGFDDGQLDITCRPLAPGIDDEKTFTITTYGPLEEPTILMFTPISVNLVNLTWMAAQVPPGVSVTYHVSVANLSSTDSVEEFETTNTSITFREDGECSRFNLSVFASNAEVGNSSVAYIIQNIPISPDVTPTFNSLTVLVDLRNGVSMTFSFSPADVCSVENFPVLYYNFTVLNTTEVIINCSTTNCSNVIDIAFDASNITELAVDQSYDVSVSACSSVTCRTTEIYTAYTSEVQRPTVYYVEDTVQALLVCEFAIGANASGCLFEFSLTNTDGDVINREVNFTRNSKVNSSLCGNSQACMCFTGAVPLPGYTSIHVYPLEDDLVTWRNSVSIPAARVAVESLTECLPALVTPDPVIPGDPVTRTNNTVIIIVVVIVIVAVVMIVTLIVPVCVYRRWKNDKKRKKNYSKDHKKVLPLQNDGEDDEDEVGSHENEKQLLLLKKTQVFVEGYNKGELIIRIGYDDQELKDTATLLERRSKKKRAQQSAKNGQKYVGKSKMSPSPPAAGQDMMYSEVDKSKKSKKNQPLEYAVIDMSKRSPSPPAAGQETEQVAYSKV